MRIGEVKNIIAEAINSNQQIEILSQPAYNNGAQIVNNFGKILRVFDVLSGQDWNKADYKLITDLKNRYQYVPQATLDIETFNQFKTQINLINTGLPIFYSAIKTFADVQPEQALNIKLPDSLRSLDDLSKTNEKLDNIFKTLNIDGEFKFEGFDKGTWWYVLVTNGRLTYQYALACIKIAKDYLEARKTFYESEEARAAYELTLKKDEKPSEKGYDEYQKMHSEVLLDKKVYTVIEEISGLSRNAKGQINGRSVEELHTHLLRATTNLVKELGDGVEFHLSLNPPAYALEQAGSLVIDYKKIRQENIAKIESDAKTRELPPAGVEPAIEPTSPPATGI